MRLEELKQTVNIAEGVTVTADGNSVSVKGEHGEIARSWNEPRVSIAVQENQIVLTSKNATKKQKRMLATMRAQIKNAVKGVKESNEYELKICSSHFPMQVAMEGQSIVVKNFLGEKVPRKIELSKEADVKIQGDKIIVKHHDIEIAGETASKIEQLCRITDKDRRKFQDGIYLISKK